MPENIIWEDNNSTAQPKQTSTISDVVRGSASKVRLRYPPDITSPVEGHTNNPYMIFNAVKFRSKQIQIDGKTANSVSDFFKTLGADSLSQLDVATKQRKELGIIILPMPKDISNDVGLEWEMADLKTIATVASSLNATSSAGLGALVDGAKSLATIYADRTAKIFFNKTPNPRKQALFNGVSPRQFSFTWTFAPQSRKEAELVHEIIKQFTVFSLPQLETNTSAFYDFPAEFEISFSENVRGMPKFSSCVCTGVMTNYNPSADIQFLEDGHTVQTQLTLNFIETELLRQNKPGV